MRSFSPLASLGTSAPWKNGLFRLPSSPDFLSLGSFRLDLRIYRTSALLFFFYSFRIRHFRIRYIWYINFSGILVESYGTWLLFQRLDDSSKDSDIPKNVPFAFAINNRNIGGPGQGFPCSLLPGTPSSRLRRRSCFGPTMFG